MNIPNALTIGRLFLVPTVIVAIGQEAWLGAFALFVLAGVTDGLDGFIAKRFDQRTKLGAYLDPLADKALLVSIYVTLAIVGVSPRWLAIVVVSRDLMIMGAVILSWVLEDPVEIDPLRVSKANTTAQIAFAALTLGAHAFDLAWDAALSWLAVAVGVLTTVSAGAYLLVWARHVAGDKTDDTGGENRRTW